MLFGLWSFSVSVLYLFFCRFFQAGDWSKNLPPDCRERYWLASISTVKQVGIKNSLWACSPTLIFLHPLATLHLPPPPPSAPRYNDHRSYISLKLVVQTFRLTRCVCVCVCVWGGGGCGGGKYFLQSPSLIEIRGRMGEITIYRHCSHRKLRKYWLVKT